MIELRPAHYTVREAADMLGLERTTLYKRIRNNRMATVKDASNRLRVPAGEVYVAAMELENRRRVVE